MSVWIGAIKQSPTHLNKTSASLVRVDWKVRTACRTISQIVLPTLKVQFIFMDIGFADFLKFL